MDKSIKNAGMTLLLTQALMSSMSSSSYFGNQIAGYGSKKTITQPKPTKAEKRKRKISKTSRRKNRK